jgi:hypothetical protein
VRGEFVYVAQPATAMQLCAPTNQTSSRCRSRGIESVCESISSYLLSGVAFLGPDMQLYEVLIRMHSGIVVAKDDQVCLETTL